MNDFEFAAVVFFCGVGILYFLMSPFEDESDE